MNDNFVSINNLSKVFKARPALKEINASFSKGKMVGLVGPDGAGKTTLIRLLAGLLLPTEGSISVNGFDTVKEAHKIHEICGYMPQKFGLYEDLTVMQNLELYSDLRGLKEEEKQTTFDRLLAFTGLQPFTKRLARDLSGGMKQKLGLACSLIKKPNFLLLDEPSVGVDPVSRRELWKMVQDQLHEGISVVWSTAYLDEAEKCDIVLLINEGKLLFFGDPKDLTKKVEDRVFKITHVAESDKRKLLTEVSEDENVIDAVISGDDLRVVLKDKDHLLKQQHLEKTTPRFEDAFIDILGGGPGGVSELANITKKIEEKRGDVIEAKELTKKFGTFTAADHISFSIHTGEVFGLLGPNGAGKSTTFKMLCGLLKPTSGSALVMGLDLEISTGLARSQIGYMAQKFSLHGNLSVRQNLEFFSGIYNLKGKQKKEAVDEMVEIFYLKPYLNTSADILPLGFKQRLALACATMHQPKILFLDEPTSGVDPLTRREFWNHINGLVQKGVTIMVTTHFMDEAEYCDRIALVFRGKIIELDTPDNLKKRENTATLEEAFIKLIEDN